MQQYLCVVYRICYCWWCVFQVDSEGRASWRVVQKLPVVVSDEPWTFTAVGKILFATFQSHTGNLRVWLKRWTVCVWNVKNKICQLPESPRFVVEYRSTQWHVTQRPSSCVGKPCYVLPEKFLHGLNSKLFRMCNRWLHCVVYTCMASYYISIHEYSSSSFM